MGKQLKFLFLATLTTLMVLAGSILQVGEPLMASPSSSAVAIANQIYTQYPNIPRAEQTDTTLVSRFIAYHLNDKARPSQYHFDWELSMADYLDSAYGINTAISSMTTADKQTMQALSRHQRHQLIGSLEQFFSK